MRVVVAHGLTREAEMPIMDKALEKLLAGAGSSSIQILDQKKAWADSVMNFSFTGKLGFISVPITGTILVEYTNVTVDMELPPVVKTFIGEEKIRAIVDENVRSLLRSSQMG
jgi:hypothetical protein